MAKVKTQIQPLRDHVLIRRLEKGEEQSSGGIILPDKSQEKPHEGEVIAVGPGRTTDDGKRQAISVKEGQRVLFGKYAGTEIKRDDEELLIMREDDILAVVS